MAKFIYKHAPITAFLLVQEALKYAEEKKVLVLLIGSTGYGKTSSIDYFIDHHVNVMYFKIRPAQNAKGFFTIVHDALNGTQTKGNVTSFSSLDWLIQTSSYDFLTKKSALLIIDEAGNFKKAAQSYLRQVWDNINNRAGMVISGPDRYKIDLERWNRDLSSGIPEFVSRIDYRVELPPPSYDDVKLICNTNQIDSTKIIRYIYDNSANLRNIRNYVIAHHEGNLDIE